MKRIFALIAGAAAVVGLATTGATAGTKDQKGVVTKECKNRLGETEAVFTYDGVTVAWPPNHKTRTAVVTLTDPDAEPALDDVTLAITASHDQIAADGKEFVGSGNTKTDFVMPAATSGKNTTSGTVSFLGERSGTDQTGRTYTFVARGTTDNGTFSCSVPFTAEVPHDQGNN